MVNDVGVIYAKTLQPSS